MNLPPPIWPLSNGPGVYKLKICHSKETQQYT